MIRILIADDHAVVRQGLKQILTEAFKLARFGEAASAEEVLEHACKQDWDVVILDISMPGKSGLEGLKELKRERPKLPVVVMSFHAEEQYATRTLKAGASGYLTKDSAPEELVKAVRKAVAGGRYVSASLAEKLAFDLAAQTGKPLHEALSDREFQVLRLIASGKAVSEIAEQLALSVKTVSTYRVRLLEKMRMKNNAELMRYAFQNHLVE